MISVLFFPVHQNTACISAVVFSAALRQPCVVDSACAPEGSRGPVLLSGIAVISVFHKNVMGYFKCQNRSHGHKRFNHEQHISENPVRNSRVFAGSMIAPTGMYDTEIPRPFNMSAVFRMKFILNASQYAKCEK